MNAMSWKFVARGLVVLWTITILAMASQPAAQPAPPPVQFPKDYRSWQHVRTIVVGSESKSFATRGGIHHYYANKEAVEGYRSGRFPNGSIIVDEGVLTEDGTGPFKGILLEANRRSLDVMVKHDQLYSATGGWGFEHFEKQEEKGQLDADAKRRTACFECHSMRKDSDYVFSAIRVAKFAP